MLRSINLLILLAFAHPVRAQSPADSAALQHSLEQLRSAIGSWQVETQFLGDDGSVARTVRGTYEFAWVIPDRVVRGQSTIPDLQQTSAILFYLRASRREIEMVSVGADGVLWVMTGPLGGETRTTQEFDTAGGGRSRLRFTRFNVSADRFESRMEYTIDGGATWRPGNHQTFHRAPSGNA